MKLRQSIVLPSLCCTAMSVQAAMVPVTNSSFEANPVIPGNFQVLVPQGWDIYDPHGIIDQNGDVVGAIDPNGTTFFTSIPEGRHAAIVYLGTESGTRQEAGLSQILDAVLQPFHTYTLTVHVGNIASGTGLPPSDIYGYFNLNGFPGYRIELLAGNSVLAADHNSLGETIPEGAFAVATLQFTCSPYQSEIGARLGIRLINLNLPGTTESPGIEVDFDHIQLLQEEVPGPRLSINKTNDAVHLSWPLQPPRVFELQSSSNPGFPLTWASITNLIEQRNGVSTTVITNIGSDSPQFFRLRSLSP